MTTTLGKNSSAAILRHWREAVPNDRLAHLIKDAARVLNRALQTRLAEHGVSFGHWTFLRILWEQDGATQRELSHAAGVMEPTTHSAMISMETLGLVERRRKEGDRRNLHIFLTAKAKRLKPQLVAHAVAVNKEAVRGVATQDASTTRSVLLAIIENMVAADSRTTPQPQSARKRQGTNRPKTPIRRGSSGIRPRGG